MLLDKIKLEPNEEVIIQTRRHWFILFGHLAFFVIAALFPLLCLWLVQVFIPQETLTFNLSDYTALIAYIYSLWLFFLWIGAFSAWTNYYLDVLTVTDRRAILVNQKGLFRRSTTSFRLERLQDMNIEINGFIATLLDYGTLQVETAGHGSEDFKATGLPDPRSLKAKILRASDNRIPGTENHEGL